MPPSSFPSSSSSSSGTRSVPSAASPAAWWRHGLVWLLIATPALAVAASVSVAFLAWHDADVELSTSAADLAPGGSSRTTAAKLPTAPALQGRNHAATPRP